MKSIIGKKIGMTQIFSEDGTAIPVTAVLANPVTVKSIKTKDKDGYNSVCLKSSELGISREFRVKEAVLKEVRVKQKIEVKNFEVGDELKVTGTSKGKGFQGVMKRHNFSGSPRTHGHRHDHRSGGSIGSAYPQKVFRGQKMAGRMGNEQVTVAGLSLVGIENDKNVLLIKGALPGIPGSLLKVSVV